MMAVGGLVAGVVGAVAGVGALWYAHGANALSGKSNNLAKGSNDIALDARRIALDANEYSRRSEDRETERHDVWWEGGWVTEEVYRIYKRGDDAAHDVVATVTVDREEQTVRAAKMQEEHGWLDFRFPGAAAKRAQDARDNEAAARRAAAAANDPLRQAWPQSYVHAVAQSAPAVRFQVITERIDWTTDRGTPRSHSNTGKHLL